MPSPLRQHTWLPMSLLATHTRDLAASSDHRLGRIGARLEWAPRAKQQAQDWSRARLLALNHGSAKDEGAWPKLRILFMWGGLWGAPGSFEPVGSPCRTPNTSPTESVTRRGAPPLQVGRGCSTTGTAADSGKVTPLLPPKVVSRHQMPTPVW